ncbi:uncharacterized protein VTP21DRAFT_9404 [Calcarisporiella thermophila]|uniref:uncharacterized protein n=1 Tax=Calcarisporiella thermophila TaxID=911321 RepID=UPI003743718A
MRKTTVLSPRSFPRISKYWKSSLAPITPPPSPNTSKSRITSQLVNENDPPWTGDESIQDSVLRMLIDKYPRPLPSTSIRSIDPRPPERRPVMIQLENEIQTQRKKKKPSPSRQERLDASRDRAIVYASTKQIETSSPNPRPSTLAGWRSLVEQRINEAQERGEFAHLPGLGKPLPTDPAQENPWIDRTEALMNRLIKRQNAAPPFVEMQRDMNEAIEDFRRRLRDDYARFLKAFGPGESQRFQKERQAWIREGVLKINRQIENYNIIAPFSAQRLLLTEETEWKRLVQDQELNANQQKKQVKKKEDSKPTQ